ncbi:hypothetical protein GALL_512540 [mine drainage metagenome]|uniref:Uncharacterized protein n=1 Tax=mine drainage metagenome TaxID=410659 RepID=A0A1J5PPF0_9ZZZZ
MSSFRPRSSRPTTSTSTPLRAPAFVVDIRVRELPTEAPRARASPVPRITSRASASAASQREPAPPGALAPSFRASRQAMKRGSRRGSTAVPRKATLCGPLEMSPMNWVRGSTSATAGSRRSCAASASPSGRDRSRLWRSSPSRWPGGSTCRSPSPPRMAPSASPLKVWAMKPPARLRATKPATTTISVRAVRRRWRSRLRRARRARIIPTPPAE